MERQPLEIEANRPAELVLELELADATVDAEERTISGTLVPFGEVGIASVDGAARRIVYRQGDHKPFRDRTPLVLGHDEHRPVGVMSSLSQDEHELRATFRVDRTRDGDDALEQAASGSRSGLSGGMVATRYTETSDGTLDVTASVLRHVGLVAIPAFESANVSRVAASHAEQPNERSGSPMDPKRLRKLLGLAEDATDQEVADALASRELTLEQFVAAHGEDEPEAETPAAEAETVAAAAAPPVERPVVHAARPRTPQVTAGALVLAMLAAERGDRNAARLVEAALTTVVSTDVPGLMPAAQTNEILGGLQVNRVLAERVAARRPLPATGMEISKPKWGTLPQGGWRANVPGAGEDDAIATNKPTVTLDSIDVLEWAYGVSLSYAVATRSSPDAIEAIYRAAVEDYYRAVEIKLAALLEADAVDTAAGAGVGAAIALSFSSDANKPKAPELLIVAPDVYGDLVDVIDSIPTYSDGNVSGAGMTGTIAGLEVVVSPYLTAGTEIVGPRGGIELRESNPIRLTANTIGALQVELGVTAFATFDDEAAAGSYQMMLPPAGAPSGTSSAKRTSRSKKGDK